MNWLERLISRQDDTGESGNRKEPVLDSSPSIRNSAPTQANWNDFIIPSMTAAGMPVTEETVMRITAVYACVSLIGGSIASMPLHIYERTPDGRKKVDHDLWWLFNEQPNDRITAATFWEYTTGAKLLHGDSLAKIVRASPYSPKIIGFEELHPRCLEVQEKDGRLYYTIWRDRMKPEVVDQDDILHIPGPGFDGKRGLSTIRHALQDSGGIALAANQYSASFFKNGARPDFVLSAKGNLSPEQADVIRKTWGERHQGPNNAHLPAVLFGDMDVKQLTMSAEDAQLLGTRGFQIEEIARMFGVPPFMIGHNEKTTSWGSGIEQMSLGFIKFTLLKHLVKIQQEINRKCFKTSKYFCEFNTAGLERGDLKGRYEAYRIALGRAGERQFLKVNEVRRLENLEPVEGGDELDKGQKTDESTSKTVDRQPAYQPEV